MTALRLAVLVLIPAVLAAQVEHRGVVQSQGMPIPGAVLTATRNGQTLSTITAEDGSYNFPKLAPGEWEIEIRIYGFAPLSGRIELEEGAGADPGAAEWQLTLGEASEEEEDGEAVQDFVVQEQWLEAPQAGVLGEEEAGEAFLVNGSVSSDLARWAQLREAPPEPKAAEDVPLAPEEVPEAVQDGPAKAKPAKAKPAKASAQNKARLAASKKGSYKKTARKQGGNRIGNKRKKSAAAIRGAASLAFGPGAMQARPFSFTGYPMPRPALSQDRMTVAAGGPVQIPWLSAGQKSLLFGTFSRSSAQSPFSAVDIVPSGLERSGDFSQSRIRGPATIYDPASRLPFPGNRIPASRVNPAAAGLLDFFAQPNQPASLQNYQILESAPRVTTSANLRYNQSLPNKNRLSLSFGWQGRESDRVQLFGFRDAQDSRGYNVDLGWTRSFSRQFITNARFSLRRTRSDNLPFFAYGEDVAGRLGIQGTSRDPANFGPPGLSFTNFGRLSDGVPSLRLDRLSTLSGGLQYVRKRHTFSAGAEIRQGRMNVRTDQNGRGSFSFSGLATSGLDAAGQPLASTGFDFADFLLGLPQSSSIRYGASHNDFRATDWNLHVEDEWRIRPNFSATLGLRYEFFQPVREASNRMVNLDIAPGITGVAPVLPLASGAYSGVFPEGLIDPDRNNLAPRVGLAWKPSRGSDWLLRAGYGWHYNGTVYQGFATKLASQPPFAVTSSQSTSPRRVLTLENGFAPPESAKVTNTYAVLRAYRVGYAQTWTASVQRSFASGMVAEAGYLGTKGTRLDMERHPNRAAPGSPLTAEERRLIGNAVGFTLNTSEGNSILHAANLRLTRRMSKGIGWTAQYTWSKTIDNASSIGGVGRVVAQNDKDLRSERGLSSFDQRHRLAATWMLASPFSGARALGGAQDWRRKLFRDWTLDGTVSAATGTPRTARVMGNRADSSGTGVVGSGRADSSGESIFSGDGFFNPAAFVVPPPGRYGNAGRNTVPLPTTIVQNLTLARNFRLSERVWLRAHIEATNAFNRVNYKNLATVINARDYGLATDAGAMRGVVMGLRVRF